MNKAKQGHFQDDYFSPVRILTVMHTPWVHKNFPIPTGLLNKVINMFKEKIAAGVYEPLDALYYSHWFCVPKKNGSLQLVHDLQPLNTVTICNATVSPLVDQFVKGIAAHSCYSMLGCLLATITKPLTSLPVTLPVMVNPHVTLTSSVQKLQELVQKIRTSEEAQEEAKVLVQVAGLVSSHTLHWQETSAGRSRQMAHSGPQSRRESAA